MTQHIKSHLLSKRRLYTALAMLIGLITIGTGAQAQIGYGGIGTTPGNPAHPSATYDIKYPAGTANFKGGLLIPRGVLNSATDNITTSGSTAQANGLLFFNFGSTAMPKGMYYWDSTGVGVGKWTVIGGMLTDSIWNAVKNHSDSLTADKFIKVLGSDSSVLKKVVLNLDVVTLAHDTLFNHTLAHDTSFNHTLAHDTSFSHTLARDTSFSHTLARDTSFSHTLARDTAFTNMISKDSIVINTVRNAAVQFYGNMVVKNDADYTVLDSNYTVVIRSMSQNRTLTLPDPATCAGRVLNIIQTTYTKTDGTDVYLRFNYPVIYSDAVTLNYLDAAITGGQNGSLKVTLQSDGSNWYVINLVN